MAGLMAAALAVAAQAQPADDPLTRPIAPEYSARWLGAQAPARIHGRTHAVGFEGLNVVLVDTGDGLLLFDGAVPQAVDEVEANIRRLGFSIDDVRYIFSTEPHYDHAGGIAALARDSGATVVASAAAAEVLRSGRVGPEDPQAAHLPPFPAVETVRVVADGETLRLGDTEVVAVATPGHTVGSMSWRWRSCEQAGCANIVFAASLNPVSADGYRFSAHPEVVATFRTSHAVFRAMPCDILLTSHPDQQQASRISRLAAGRVPNPFIDPAACRAYADTSEQRLAARLADEAR
nr:subclass B3 metallo-beta-lactamase [Sphingosinicella terrae]